MILKFPEKVEQTNENMSLWKEFIDYWTEQNHRSKKQRWETQPTFDVSRRFKRWIASNKKNATTSDKKKWYDEDSVASFKTIEDKGGDKESYVDLILEDKRKRYYLNAEDAISLVGVKTKQLTKEIFFPGIGLVQKTNIKGPFIMKDHERSLINRRPSVNLRPLPEGKNKKSTLSKKYLKDNFNERKEKNIIEISISKYGKYCTIFSFAEIIREKISKEKRGKSLASFIRTIESKAKEKNKTTIEYLKSL